MQHDLVIHTFSRSDMESWDVSDFLNIYDFENLPSGPPLQKMMNSLIFAIDGYNDDPREIAVIPEIREFYSAFQRAWPYWLYFCSLDSVELRTMVACCLPNIALQKVDQHPIVAIDLNARDTHRFLAANLGSMNAVCERAGMSEQQMNARTKDVFAYFGLPVGAKLAG
jgi:hypothetical protein